MSILCPERNFHIRGGGGGVGACSFVFARETHSLYAARMQPNTEMYVFVFLVRGKGEMYKKIASGIISVLNFTDSPQGVH